MEGYLPILILFLVTGSTCALVLLLSRQLGPHRPDEVKDTPYEGGDDPLGRARVRLTVPFFRVAILFLLFATATVFLFLWAVSYERMLEQGNAVLVAMLIFLATLSFGYVYSVRKGAIDWD